MNVNVMNEALNLILAYELHILCESHNNAFPFSFNHHDFSRLRLLILTQTTNINCCMNDLAAHLDEFTN